MFLVTLIAFPSRSLQSDSGLSKGSAIGSHSPTNSNAVSEVSTPKEGDNHLYTFIVKLVE
jgi:hypothetical protein